MQLKIFVFGCGVFQALHLSVMTAGSFDIVFLIDKYQIEITNTHRVPMERPNWCFLYARCGRKQTVLDQTDKRNSDAISGGRTGDFKAIINISWLVNSEQIPFYWLPLGRLILHHLCGEAMTQLFADADWPFFKPIGVHARLSSELAYLRACPGDADGWISAPYLEIIC